MSPDPVVAAGTVAKPGMIAYCFAPAAGDDPAGAETVAQHLAWRWRACLELDMRVGVEGSPPLPADPLAFLAGELRRPMSEVEPTAEILVAVTRPDEESAYAAFLFRLLDAIGLAVQLAPNVETDSLERWARLRGEWRDALTRAGHAPAGGRLLGEAMLFTALWPGALPEPAELGPELEAVLELGGAPAVDVIEPQIMLWETARDPRRDRVLAAIARQESEGSLDDFVWWDSAGRVGLAPFIRYLLNAAKLRYELAVLQDGIPEQRAARRRVDERVDALIAAQARLSKRGTARIDSLLDAQVELGTAQTEAAGLLRAITRLRELRQTGRVAMQNMRAALSGRDRTESASGAGPLARDTALGVWLEDQVEHELTYLQAAKDRADEASAVTTLRLQHTADARARLQNQLTLFQASLVGGLLAVIGAVQALDPDLPLASRLDMPIAAFVGAAVFALPLLVVDWFEPFGVLEFLACGILGAAAGWLVARWTFADPSVIVELVAAVAGAAACVAALKRVNALVVRRAESPSG